MLSIRSNKCIYDIEFNLNIGNIIKTIEPNLKYTLIIIDSNEENAFTTVDKNGKTIIAIYSGLIKSLTAEEFVGVLCHEIGHIHHKHVLSFMYLIHQRLAAIKALSLLNCIPYVNILSLLLLSNEHNNIMIYSKQNETEADLYAFNRLNQLKWPVQGIVNLFEKWSYNESKNYFSSHPWSSLRKIMAEKYVITDHLLPYNIKKNYEQIQSRLNKGLYEGALSRQSPSNLYEKIWNDYLNKNYNTTLVDKILEKNKTSNQYYSALYLKAKMLTKSGYQKKAIYYMQKVYDNTKHSEALYEKIYLELKHNDSSITQLKEIEYYKSQNEHDPRIWNLLAFYYAKINNRGAFLYFKSEYSFSQNNLRKSKEYAKKAMKILPKHSSFYKKCTDLLNVIAQTNL